LDLRAFEARYGEERPGEPVFDPRMMLTVLAQADQSPGPPPFLILVDQQNGGQRGSREALRLAASLRGDTIRLGKTLPPVWYFLPFEARSSPHDFSAEMKKSCKFKHIGIFRIEALGGTEIALYSCTAV
jgi:hypothetical protein